MNSALMWTAVLCLAISGIPVPASGGCRSGTCQGNDYFGVLPATVDYDRLIDELKQLRTCREAPTDCAPATAALKRIIGSVYRSELPDLLAYYTSPEKTDGATVYGPVIMYRGQATPFLFGAEHIWVLVVSDDKAVTLSAKATDIVQKPVNPFSAIFSALDFASAAAGESEVISDEVTLKWSEIASKCPEATGKTECEKLYLAAGRLSLNQGAIGRVSIRPRQSNPSVSTQVTVKLGSGGERTATEIKRTVGSDKSSKKLADEIIAEQTPVAVKRVPPFQAMSAFFSNSKGSFAGVALGLGATFHADSTGLDNYGGETHLNGYVLSKFYLRRPRLGTTLDRRTFRPSIGLTVGTNLQDDPFEQLVAAVSVGHVVGSVGAFIGGNLVPPSDSSDNRGRKWRLVFGVDYSF